MTLGEKQRLFPILVARLIQFAKNNNYEVTFGETYRSPEMAALYAEQGKGIRNSLHCVRLAIDFNFFKLGKYLRETEDIREIGEWWEMQSGEDYECCWGGRFSDGNHFSIKYNGIK